MKNFEWDNVWVGFGLGVLMPVVFGALYYLLVDSLGLNKLNISICVATNLIPFYIYQKKEMNDGLKGVLIATFIWAGLIIFFSFFTDYLRIG